jgi:catechol 2,3-dioxygenase
MPAHPPPLLSHFGLYVRELEPMVLFYSGLFALEVTDRGRSRFFSSDLVFLSARPEHHHQLVLSSGRPEGARFSTVMQLSFQCAAIDDLRRIAGLAPGLGASRVTAVNHGNAFSLYLRDPEDNMVEAYFTTPFHVAQPHAEPLDLARADPELLAETEAACRRDPTFLTAEQWRARFSGRLAATGPSWAHP